MYSSVRLSKEALQGPPSSLLALMGVLAVQALGRLALVLTRRHRGEANGSGDT
jgi:hypothetical protein